MEVSRVLLKRGASVTAQDKFGDTPLNLAMSMGRMELACILLEGGVDVRAFVQAFLSTTTSGGGEVSLETSDGRVEVACVSQNGAAGL
jgi:ankyrin repeat protein